MGKTKRKEEEKPTPPGSGPSWFELGPIQCKTEGGITGRAGWKFQYGLPIELGARSTIALAQPKLFLNFETFKVSRNNGKGIHSWLRLWTKIHESFNRIVLNKSYFIIVKNSPQCHRHTCLKRCTMKFISNTVGPICKYTKLTGLPAFGQIVTFYSFLPQ